MANQVTGRVFITVNGDLLRSKEGAKFMLGGFERNEVMGNEIHGYAEKPIAPTIECTITHMADTNLDDFANIIDADIEFETDTGDQYVMHGSWLKTPPELTGGEGEVALKFTGINAERSTQA